MGHRPEGTARARALGLAVFLGLLAGLAGAGSMVNGGAPFETAGKWDLEALLEAEAGDWEYGLSTTAGQCDTGAFRLQCGASRGVTAFRQGMAELVDSDLLQSPDNHFSDVNFGIISVRTGLTPSEPIPTLTGKYAVWEEYLERLPEWVHNGGLYDALGRMPLVSAACEAGGVECLAADGELLRAHVVLSYLSQAWVFHDSSVFAHRTEERPARLDVPDAITVPLHTVATRLGRLSGGDRGDGGKPSSVRLAGTFSWYDMFTTNYVRAVSDGAAALEHALPRIDEEKSDAHVWREEMKQFMQVMGLGARFVRHNCEPVFIQIVVIQNTLFRDVIEAIAVVSKLLSSFGSPLQMAEMSRDKPKLFAASVFRPVIRQLQVMAATMRTMELAFDQMDDDNCPPVAWWDEVAVWAQPPPVPGSLGPNGLQFFPTLVMDSFLRRNSKSSRLEQQKAANIAALPRNYRRYLEALEKSRPMVQLLELCRGVREYGEGYGEVSAKATELVDAFNEVVNGHAAWLKKHLIKAGYYIDVGSNGGKKRNTSGGSLAKNTQKSEAEDGAARTVERAPDHSGGGVPAPQARDTVDLKGAGSVLCSGPPHTDTFTVLTSLLRENIYEREMLPVPLFLGAKMHSSKLEEGSILVTIEVPQDWAAGSDVGSILSLRPMYVEGPPGLENGDAELSTTGSHHDQLQRLSAVKAKGVCSSGSFDVLDLITLGQRNRREPGDLGSPEADCKLFVRADHLKEVVEMRPLSEGSVQRLQAEFEGTHPGLAELRPGMDWVDAGRLMGWDENDVDPIRAETMIRFGDPIRNRHFSVVSVVKDEARVTTRVSFVLSPVRYAIDGRAYTGSITSMVETNHVQMSTIALERGALRSGPIRQGLDKLQKLSQRDSKLPRPAVAFCTAGGWPLCYSMAREWSESKRPGMVYVIARTMESLPMNPGIEQLSGTSVKVHLVFTRLYEGDRSACDFVQEKFTPARVQCQSSDEMRGFALLEYALTSRWYRDLGTTITFANQRISHHQPTWSAKYIARQVIKGLAVGTIANTITIDQHSSMAKTIPFFGGGIRDYFLFAQVFVVGPTGYGPAVERALIKALDVFYKERTFLLNQKRVKTKYLTERISQNSGQFIVGVLKSIGMWHEELYGGQVRGGAVEDDGSPAYSCDQVQNIHENYGRCVVTYMDKVFDITEYLGNGAHPGGSEPVLAYCGRDITAAFHSIGHSEDSLNVLSLYRKGRVVPPDMAPSTVEYEAPATCTEKSAFVDSYEYEITFGVHSFTNTVVGNTPATVELDLSSALPMLKINAERAGARPCRVRLSKAIVIPSLYENDGQWTLSISISSPSNFVFDLVLRSKNERPLHDFMNVLVACVHENLSRAGGVAFNSNSAWGLFGAYDMSTCDNDPGAIHPLHSDLPDATPAGVTPRGAILDMDAIDLEEHSSSEAQPADDLAGAHVLRCASRRMMDAWGGGAAPGGSRPDTRGSQLLADVLSMSCLPGPFHPPMGRLKDTLYGSLACGQGHMRAAARGRHGCDAGAALGPYSPRSVVQRAAGRCGTPACRAAGRCLQGALKPAYDACLLLLGEDPTQSLSGCSHICATKDGEHPGAVLARLMASADD